MSKFLAPLLALTAATTLAIGGYALAADGDPDLRGGGLVQVPESEHADAREVPADQDVPADTTTTTETAEPYEGPGTVDEPVHACLELDDRIVCDTFGETDEGPGTTTLAPAASGRATSAPVREVAEPYEGPGTVDEPVHACLELDDRNVCDTFGETDEGPGTRGR